MNDDPRLRLKAEDRARLDILFLAKHAKGSGAPDPVDGTHAVYHHELAETLRGLGLNLRIGNRYDDLIAAEAPDFVFTLLNRGGFLNSEMLAPLVARWRGIPHLGASPILRGLGDDKHLMKLAARARGVPTPESEIHRRGSGPLRIPDLGAKMVVKPNASSASWGVKIMADRAEMRAHADWLLGQGHDVLFEAYAEGIELAVPVIGGRHGEPVWLPVMKYVSADDDRIRTYEEKRGLVPSSEGFHPLGDLDVSALATEAAARMIPEIWPFDYGRFEFKYDPESGALAFLELNMSCNLWSRKTLGLSWRSLGWSHAELVETILCHSLLRQGVIADVEKGDGHDDDGAGARGEAPGRGRPAFAG